MAKKLRPKKLTRPKKRAVTKAPNEVSFDYVKSVYHRVVWASGAHGGPAPTGRYLHMSVYNERQPIPKRETFALDGKGAAIRLVSREQRDALIREVETTILMDVDTAVAVYNWLAVNIRKLQALEKKRIHAIRKSNSKN